MFSSIRKFFERIEIIHKDCGAILYPSRSGLTHTFFGHIEPTYRQVSYQRISDRPCNSMTSNNFHPLAQQTYNLAIGYFTLILTDQNAG